MHTHTRPQVTFHGPSSQVRGYVQACYQQNCEDPFPPDRRELEQNDYVLRVSRDIGGAGGCRTAGSVGSTFCESKIAPLAAALVSRGR